jgi:peptidoglycan-associated lipoprotein
MRLKIVSLFAAVLLVAACESTPETADDMASTGDTTTTTTTTTTVTETQLDPRSIEYVQQMLGDRVFFDFDSSVVRPDAEATIRRWADWMNSYSDILVVIEGHCDERGTREYNLALGERRANAVKNVLTALGVSPTRVATISYGKERPAVEGHNEAAWQQNRRAVLVLG